jgi:hypothetical protein
MDDADARAAGKTIDKAPVTRAEWVAYLTKLETRAGRNFKPADQSKARDLYLDYLALRSQPRPFFTPSEPTRWSQIYRNPFVNVKSLFNTEEAGGADAVKANQASYEKQVDRAKKIFGDAQKAIIDFIADQAKAAKTQAEKDAFALMSTRLQTIRFKAEALPPSDALCEGPNAFYAQMNHTFTVCPQILQMPEESLKEVISHEIGHSIDPCNISAALIAVDGERIAPPIGASGAALLQAPPIIPFEPKDDSAGASPDSYTVPQYGDGASYLKKKYKNFRTTQVTTGIGLAANPFGPVISCLKSPESIGAAVPSQDNVAKSLDTAIDALANKQGLKDGESEALRQMRASRKDLPALFRDKGACNFLAGPGRKSKMQEAFADWVASKVVERDISAESDPAKKHALAFESLGMELSFGCGRHIDLAVRDPDAAALLKKLGCDKKDDWTSDKIYEDLRGMDDANAINSSTHPFDADRVNRLLLANPVIGRAMGCDPKVHRKGVKSCG